MRLTRIFVLVDSVLLSNCDPYREFLDDDACARQCSQQKYRELFRMRELPIYEQVAFCSTVRRRLCNIPPPWQMLPKCPYTIPLRSLECGGYAIFRQTPQRAPGGSGGAQPSPGNFFDKKKQSPQK